MISRVTRLVRELRLRHRRDTVARIRHAFQLRTGRLRKQYAPEPSPWTRVSESDLPDAHLSIFSSAVEYALGDDSTRAGAGELLAGQYSIFGKQVNTLPEQIDWHASINAPGSWPRQHWTEIPFKSLSELGDIKYAWELARQQMLIPLAAAFQSDKQAINYARRIRATMVRFWDDNPREIGVHYISNMEIGIRSLVWLWCFAACEEAEVFDEEFRTRLARELFLNGRHIAEKIGFTEDTGRNNHLIGDAASLHIISQAFPHSNEARAWHGRSAEVLRQCLREQFLDSGMHFERSFGYLCFVLEFFWCVHLADGTEASLKHEVGKQLGASTTLLARFATPTGGLPAINDDDDGYVFYPLRSRSNQRDWLIALRNHFLEADATTQPGGADDDFRYFHHDSGCAVFVDHHGDPFPDSGHNHASLLHVLSWLDGKPILVDSGTYGYNGTGALRNQFRGSSFHNTVTLDGQEQAEPSRGFGWLSLANPGSCEGHVNENELSFVGEHQCLDDASHRRVVYWNQQHRVLAIRDSLVCRDHRDARQYWHFSPDLDLLETEESIRVSSPNTELRVHFPGGDSRVTLHHDREHFPECAFSAAYGDLTNKPVICRSWQTDGKPRWVVFCSDESVTLSSGTDESIEGRNWRLVYNPPTQSIRFLGGSSPSIDTRAS